MLESIPFSPLNATYFRKSGLKSCEKGKITLSKDTYRSLFFKVGCPRKVDRSQTEISVVLTLFIVHTYVLTYYLITVYI